MQLCGDIGGTKALLALYDDAAGCFNATARLDCADHADFVDLLGAFLAANHIAPGVIRGGCLAVAGPIDDDGRRAKITNLPWTIDADVLSQRFGIGALLLANDFAAAALGVTACGMESLHCLQAGAPLTDGVRLVIGAGTGLGMAVLLRDGKHWRVAPGEGGHVGFSPADAGQAALMEHLRRRHGRVTWERVVSGPGLCAIHDYLGGGDDDAAVIAANAMSCPGSPADRAMQIFLSAYGAFAGDMAMAVMARGGVYLCGGIAAKILPLMQRGPFLSAFNAKAEHAALAARMPVYVVLDGETGLKGAALLAARH